MGGCAAGKAKVMPPIKIIISAGDNNEDVVIKVQSRARQVPPGYLMDRLMDGWIDLLIALSR